MLHVSPLVCAYQWPSSQPFSSPQLSHNPSLWHGGITKSYRDQSLDYREGEELSWCPSWSNSLWQAWSCVLVEMPLEIPAGNATDPNWRVLASSDGISFRTPLKPQHSNPNRKPLANQLWCIEFLTSPMPLIIPQRLPAFLESLMPLKNWCSIHASGWKAVWSIPYVSVALFPSLKQNFIAYHSSKVSDCIFEIHQLGQSGFLRVYSDCYCRCSFEPEIITIGQSSHKIYGKNILNVQGSTSILNAHTKKVWKLIVSTL